MSTARIYAVTTDDAPLSVAAVSLRLGISPSTLRTWERRYGLGAGDRPSGSHRRYLPDDVARLSRMVDLIHSGVPTSDAAAIVRAGQVSDAGGSGKPMTLGGPDDLVHLTRSGDREGLERALEILAQKDGLVRAWTRYVHPALSNMRSSALGEEPGNSPTLDLTHAFHSVIHRINDEVSARSDEQPREVMLLTDLSEELAAHVIGVTLAQAGIRARVLATSTIGATTVRERVATHIGALSPVAAMVLGSGIGCEELISALVDEHCLDVILVGTDTPAVLDDRVLRVRTVAAAVEELIALVDA
ncbi:MAG: MerR family transcriptional regulator [Actinomycetaceae bacterium]|nr:MerR family transcriptional regulator [Actinomycetaceae bacterium]